MRPMDLYSKETAFGTIIRNETKWLNFSGNFQKWVFQGDRMDVLVLKGLVERWAVKLFATNDKDVFRRYLIKHGIEL